MKEGNVDGAPNPSLLVKDKALHIHPQVKQMILHRSGQSLEAPVLDIHVRF